MLDCLNEQQQDAVRAGLMRRALYLWGPPGTGKTTSLAALIHAQVLAGRRVLVLAPSNAACDVLALAVADRLKGLPHFDRGLMLRVGPRPSSELRARYGAQVVPQDVAERLTSEACATLIQALEEDISSSKSTLAILQQHTAAARRVSRRLCDSKQQLAQLIRSQESLQDRRCEQLLEQCRVLVTPIHNVYLSRQLRGQFDVIVVDEVSMVTLPQLFLAVALFARRSLALACSSQVILAGDFNQLAAPVAHRCADEVPWLARDVFRKVGIPDDVARDDDPPYLVMLTEQYRMATPICDFVSRLFYKGRLTTATQVANRPVPRWALGLGSLVLVDTSQLDPQTTIPQGTHSRRNAVHALVAQRLIESLTNEADGSSAGSLLVLSPYASQVELLRETLTQVRRRFGSRVRVSSVHRAQGGEADTVVLSLDDAPGARMSQFMLARDWTSDGSRLLNVAVSRGRGRVIILAAVPHLKNHGGPVIRRFLEELENVGQSIAASDL
jgi:superfamily I DNA and/or RNA helicase